MCAAHDTVKVVLEASLQNSACWHLSCSYRKGCRIAFFGTVFLSTLVKERSHDTGRRRHAALKSVKDGLKVSKKDSRILHVVHHFAEATDLNVNSHTHFESSTLC